MRTYIVQLPRGNSILCIFRAATVLKLAVTKKYVQTKSNMTN